MELEDLLFDSSRRTADIAVNTIGSNPDLFKKMLDFAMEDRGRFAMRASRVVYLSAHNHPELIRPYLKDIIHRMSTFSNDGLKRCFAKIFTELFCDYDDETLGILVNLCFDWVIDPQEKVALKVFGIEILYNISNFYPDIKNELISVIEDQIPRCTIAFKSRGKKLLVKLYRETGC